MCSMETSSSYTRLFPLGRNDYCARLVETDVCVSPTEDTASDPDNIDAAFASGDASTMGDDENQTADDNAILENKTRHNSSRETPLTRNLNLLAVSLPHQTNYRKHSKDSAYSIGTFLESEVGSFFDMHYDQKSNFERRTSNGALGNIYLSVSCELPQAEQANAVSAAIDTKLREPLVDLVEEADGDGSSAWFGCIIQYLMITRRLKVCVVGAEEEAQNNSASKKFRNLFAKIRLQPGYIKMQTIPVTKWLERDNLYKARHAYFGVYSCAEYRKMDLEIKLYRNPGIFRRCRLLSEWTISLQDCNFMEGLTVWKKIACGKQK